MIDLSCVKNAYDNEEIDDLYFIRSEFNIADALRKKETVSNLTQVTKNGIINYPVEQWHQRTKSQKRS